MSDLVSRQAALEAVHSTIFDFFDMDKDDSDSPMTESDKRLLELNKAVTTAIRKLPNIDVPARKVGKWTNDRVAYGIYKCTACEGLCRVASWANCFSEEQMYKEFKFCPNCGAMMDGGEE